MIVELGLIHRNGEEIGIITDDKEFNYLGSDYEKYFDNLSKFFISTDDQKVVDFIDQLFLKKFTMEENVVVYLRFQSFYVDPTLSRMQKMIVIANSIVSAKVIEFVVIKSESDSENLNIIEEAGSLSFLLNAEELSSYLPSLEERKQLVIGSIGSTFPDLSKLKDEFYKEMNYIEKEQFKVKETYFTRKKNLRFLGR